MGVFTTLKNTIKNHLPLKKFKQSQKFLLGVMIFLLVYFILFFSVVPLGVSVELGLPSPKTIYAPREVVDYYSTNKLREEAALAVGEVFDLNPEIQEEGNSIIANFFQEIRAIRRITSLDQEGKTVLWQERITLNINDDFFTAVLELSDRALDDLQADAERIYTGIMEQGIRENGEQPALSMAYQDISLLPFKSELRQGIEMLLYNLLQSNMVLNEEETEAKREQARQSLESVKILKNSLIVQEGEKVTENHLAQLEALGLLGTREHTSANIGLFLTLATIFTTVLLYLYFFQRDIWDNVTYLLLLSLIVIITLVFGLAGRYFSAYLTPAAIGGILITILFNYQLAIFIHVILSLLLGFLVDGDFSLLIVNVLGGLVAIYSVSRLKRRFDLTKVGVYVAAANIAVIVATVLFFRGFLFEYEFISEFGVNILAGIGSGLFSAIMSIGLLPYLENAFGLTTSITLLELADPGQPLLRKLLMETPGTYHHSIMVGNLAEAAAEATGADPLLSRVAAFYHDIGKTRRPYFFVENQFSRDNPHTKISPNLSAVIIRSHVKDGLDIAREAKLPQSIVEIIRQHHGTTLVSFFYRQALHNFERENNGKNTQYLIEEDFRYEGPIPQTKEAAIILMADSVEAAVRSLSDPIADRIEEMVKRIIKDKLSDGQFDESPLTLKDLDKIGDTFAYMLSGFYHQRIEYPEKELRADLERGK